MATKPDVKDPFLGEDEEPEAGASSALALRSNGALAPRLDIRELAQSGHELFTTIKWETIRDSKAIIYIGGVEIKDTSSGEFADTTGGIAYVCDIYSEDGELMGRCQMAAKSIQEQMLALQRAYPTAAYYGPFRIEPWGKTYHLVPVR